MASDQSVHFSSKSNEWRTPKWLFNQLNAEFSFDLDAAADKDNALCARFYTAADDALKQNWAKDAKSIWLNPPYGRLIGRFVTKAFEETTADPSLTVVMLIPARTDTKWWHACCAHGEMRMLKGRLKFENAALPSWREDRQFKLSPAPFPSAVVIFGARAKAGQTSYVVYREPRG